MQVFEDEQHALPFGEIAQQPEHRVEQLELTDVLLRPASGDETGRDHALGTGLAFGRQCQLRQQHRQRGPVGHIGLQRAERLGERQVRQAGLARVEAPSQKDDRVLGFIASTGDRDLMRVETSRGSEQTISTTKYEVTGRGGKGRELLQRGQFTRVVPNEVENPQPLTPSS